MKTLTIIDVCPVCGGRRRFSRNTLVARHYIYARATCGCPEPLEIEIQLVPPCRICEVEPATGEDGLCDGCREARAGQAEGYPK